MPWELEIHTIDVFQGESSLIVARNRTDQNATTESRTMLIDGGLLGEARNVHDYVYGILGPTGYNIPLDHVLVTHYDKDHSGGILGLLAAEGYRQICQMLATAAAQAAYDKRAEETRYRILAAAVAATAVAYGSYGTGERQGIVITLVDKAVSEQKIQTQDPLTDNNAAERGYSFVQTKYREYRKKWKHSLNLSGTQINYLIAAATAAGTPANGDVPARTAPAMNQLLPITPWLSTPESHFDTHGIYADANIIDIGDNAHANARYKQLMKGVLSIANLDRTLPGVVHRTVLEYKDLGTEILWRTGHRDAKAPPNLAPRVFAVACQKNAWGSNSSIGGTADNAEGIGLVVQFNNFFYYTGGDLPSDGENKIAEKVMKFLWPRGDGTANTMKAPRVACIKCGHHGSKHSTDQVFLDAVKPKVALISCGDGSFNDETHPSDLTIKRVDDCGSIKYFYVTNCVQYRNEIPATYVLVGIDRELQIVPNQNDKARVAGRIRTQTITPKGNILVSLNEAESRSTIDENQQMVTAQDILPKLHVQYHEHYSDNLDGARTEVVDFFND